MKVVVGIIGAVIGYNIGTYIQTDVPLVRNFLDVQYLGPTPWQMLPITLAIIGFLIGYNVFNNKK